MNLSIDCSLVRLRKDHNLTSFDCKNHDLNDFLLNDALAFQQGLMGVTYVFTLKGDPAKIVCFFTVSNDGLPVRTLTDDSKEKINQDVQEEKQRLTTYPCVKIGRLGVNCEFSKNKGFQVGKQLMDFIKAFFIDNNKTGCRFIIVDAYNDAIAVPYYLRNDFQFLFTTEGSESEHYKQFFSIRKKPPLRTRLMYYDLDRLNHQD